MKNKMSNQENTVSAIGQMVNSENVYHLGNPMAKKRLLIIGNSITLHGVRADISWYGNWGMAATKPENDYVHKLYEYLQRDGIDVYIRVRQAVQEWECCYPKENVLDAFMADRDFQADILLFRLGENIQAEYIGKPIDETELFVKMKELVEYVVPNGKALYSTCFWGTVWSDFCIRKLAEERQEPVVELGPLSLDPSMKALEDFEHWGVANHPGDKGMQAIADLLYSELKNLLKSVSI